MSFFAAALVAWKGVGVASCSPSFPHATRFPLLLLLKLQPA